MRALLFAIALSASSQPPLPTDAVRDEATAIGIAQKACALTYKSSPDSQWKAELRKGVWHVSVQLGIAQDHRGGAPPAPYGGIVEVSAFDGNPGPCMSYSTVY